METIPPIPTVLCPGCRTEKPLTEFYRNRTKPLGHETKCKPCWHKARGTKLDHPARFWAKVKRGPGCWEWQGARHRAGYGEYMLNKRPRYAHRIAYELLRGPIPAGLVLDHLCRNPACVNPDHLEPVTQAENTARGMAPGAIAHRRPTCSHGHLYTPDNTYWWHGRRQCRTCRKINADKWNASH